MIVVIDVIVDVFSVVDVVVVTVAVIEVVVVNVVVVAVNIVPYGLDELYLRRVGAQLLGLELMSDHTPDYVIGSQSALSKISRLAEASLLISHWSANERQGNIEIS